MTRITRTASALLATLLLLLVPGATTLAQTAAPSSPGTEVGVTTWHPGPGAVGDATLMGAIDEPVVNAVLVSGDLTTIRGWVVDRSAQGWTGVDDVHIYEGLAGAGGTFLGQALIQQPRPDVASALGNPFWSAAGFDIRLTQYKLQAGDKLLTVYAHTPGKGWWYRQVAVKVAAGAPNQAGPVLKVTAPKVSEHLMSNADFTITGYALEPSLAPGAGTGVDRVEVYLDSIKQVPTAFKIGEATLNQASEDAEKLYGERRAFSGFTLKISPTRYTSDNHTLYVYARSSVTGLETLVTIPFTVEDPKPAS